MFDRTLMWSSVATRHLLESRLHLVAVVEALADMDGFLPEYEKAVGIRANLDDFFLDVENKTIDRFEKIKQRGRSDGRRLEPAALLHPATNISTPKGIRTPVAAVRGRCPGPLDDGGAGQTKVEGGGRKWEGPRGRLRNPEAQVSVNRAD